MIERINDWAAERFHGVGTSRGSFLRIHVWAIVFLLLASSLAASHGVGLAYRRRFGPVENVALGQNDQRAFESSGYSKQKYFHIAWIAGSETEVFVNPLLTTYVSRLMQPILPEIGGKKVVVDVYYLPAMRVADEYFALLDAIAEKPDMIVMSLNPVWSMNPLSTHQWLQLDTKAAAALATEPDEWPIGASFLSPSDLAWGFAANHLKMVENRSYYSGKIHDLVDDLGPLDRKKLAKLDYLASLKPDRYTKVLTEQPLDFWFKHRFDMPPEHISAVNTHAMSPHRWAQWMNRSNVMDNTINQMLMRAIGKELKGSKIPSYVYLAQMNNDWLATNPEIRSATERVEKQLEDQRSDFDAPNIRFQPRTVSRFVPNLGYLVGDPVHVNKAGTLPNYLAGQLCALEAQVGKGASCTPIAGGNGDG